MENYHSLIELDVWFRDKVDVIILLGLKCSFIPGDFLDNLEVNLKFYQRNSR